MAQVVITAAEVFNDADPNRSVVSIARVGGGEYQTTDATGAKARFDTWELAYEAAVKVADSATIEELASARYKDEQLADLRVEIARLKATLPAEG